jgi:hypothetical protein
LLDGGVVKDEPQRRRIADALGRLSQTESAEEVLAILSIRQPRHRGMATPQIP